MPEQWFKIGGVPTRVFSYGKPIEQETFKRKELVLCITGNPGLSGYYTVFLSTLFRLLIDIPVWGIGHAGHDEPKDELHKMPSLRENKILYNLHGQIKHKAEFIRNHIPDDVEIHLIAHSIGAYMALKLLKINDINRRIKYSYLLFPTIEYMADSPAGKFFTGYIESNFKIIFWLAKVLAYIPLGLQEFFIAAYFWIKSIPLAFLETAYVQFKPNVLSKIIFLASDEMAQVQAPPYDIIEQNKQRISFLYSTTDKWAPVTFYERLVARFPGIDASITDQFQHAFVLNTSPDVAAFIAGQILEQTKKE